MDAVQNLAGLASGITSYTLTIGGTLTANRTFTVPNAAMTAAGQDYANTFTLAQTISATTASTTNATGSLINAGGFGNAKEIVLTASSVGAIYWGPTATDGSVRCYGNGSGAVIFEARVSGNYVEIGRFTV